jgi:hypothetical protein
LAYKRHTKSREKINQDSESGQGRLEEGRGALGDKPKGVKQHISFIKCFKLGLFWASVLYFLPLVFNSY